MTMAGMRRMLAVLCAGSALLCAAGCGVDLRIDAYKDEGTPNRPPFAFAGSDQSVTLNATVTLDARDSSDPDGDTLSFFWTLTSAPLNSSAVLVGPGTVRPTFTTDLVGTYEFLLVVSDGEASATDSVSVYASIPNAPPVANAGPNQIVVTNKTVFLNGNGSTDFENSPLTYMWTFDGRPAGSVAALSDPTSATPTFVADLGGFYTFSLTVSDGYLSSINTSTVTVEARDLTPPVAVAVANSTAVASGATVQLDGSGSYDFNNDPITYSWVFVTFPPGETPVLSNPSLVNPTFVANVAGDYVVGLVVNDGIFNSTQSNVLVNASGGTLFYRDSDLDGYGNPDITLSLYAAVAPAGYVTDNTDCDDTRASVYPTATETCNDLDDNCNTLVDDGLPTNTYYPDSDGDTFGDASSLGQVDCQHTGYVPDNTDCNDSVPTVHPNATEVCDAYDNDCDLITAALILADYYPDADKDNYGDKTAAATSVCTQPAGFVTDNTDCNDSVPTVYPNATEVCDAYDNDCNTLTAALIVADYYPDLDTDSYGDKTAVATSTCTPAPGYVTNNTDCDDAAASIHPNAVETCNSLDDDCDTLVDEGLLTAYYRDNDNDTYGHPFVVAEYMCTQPGGYSGYSTNNFDCDDANPAVNPGMAEICSNGIDDNCNGIVDAETCVMP